MSGRPVSVSADDLQAVGELSGVVEQAMRRAEGGETVAVEAHGCHVADVVPSEKIERLRETIEVLSDNGLLRDMRGGLDNLRAGRVVSADQMAADLRRRSAQQ